MLISIRATSIPRIGAMDSWIKSFFFIFNEPLTDVSFPSKLIVKRILDENESKDGAFLMTSSKYLVSDNSLIPPDESIDLDVLQEATSISSK